METNNRNKTSLTDIGGTIINGVNLVKDLFTSRKKQDQRQVDQQGRLNKVNAKTAKELADYEQELKMKMWHDTNYTAQLAEADKAGVSKAAVLGGSGASTGQGVSVGSVSGTGAADAASTQIADTQKMMAAAQINNLNADTNKKKVEAENIGADTTNKGLDAEWKTIDNKVKGLSQGDAVDIIASEAKRKQNELRLQQNEIGINENTYLDQIKEVKANAAGAVIRNAVSTKGIQVADGQIKKMSEDIAQGWAKLGLDKRNLDQNDQRIAIEKYNKEMQAKFPSMWNVVGKAMIDTFNGMGVPDYNNKIK